MPRPDTERSSPAADRRDGAEAQPVRVRRPSLVMASTNAMVVPPLANRLRAQAGGLLAASERRDALCAGTTLTATAVDLSLRWTGTALPP